MIRRKKPLKRSAPPRRRRPPKATNAARVAKRKAQYRTFLRSPEWREQRERVLARDGYMCTAVFIHHMPGGVSIVRCPETARLSCHHRRYSRNIAETPDEDIVTLCYRHHDIEEGKKMKNWR